MTIEYGGIMQRITLRADIRDMQTDDLDMLARDLIQELLMTDRLDKERHQEFRDYLAKALDQSGR